MKKIIIALITCLPFFSFDTNKLTESLESSCNPCTINSVAEIVGSGFTPGKFIGIVVTNPDNSTFKFNGASAGLTGNVYFSVGFTYAGEFNFKVYEIKNKTHWIYKTEISILVQ